MFSSRWSYFAFTILDLSRSPTKRAKRLNFLRILINDLTNYCSHPIGWGLILVTAYMGLQQWVLWAPIVAALMTAMIIMDEGLTRLSFDKLFGSSHFYQVLIITIIIGYIGYAVGRLIDRAR